MAHIRRLLGDPIVREVREHIEGCVGRSEPFSPKRLRFYQAVQRDLEKGTGPGGQENEDFPGFQEEAALVIHAEDTTSDGLPSPMRLFIPIQDPAARPMFAETPRARLRVLLYVYPAGTLLGKQTPTAAPAEFEGSVTMQNDVPDAAVTARPSNCQIGDLAAVLAFFVLFRRMLGAAGIRCGCVGCGWGF